MSSGDSSIRPSIAALRAALDVFESRARQVDAIIVEIVETLRRGNRLFSAGNGGSSAQALHLCEELIGRFAKTRRPLAATCLAADPTALTCIANDFGYEQIFARQLAALGKPGDVLVVLTTSGKSPNILQVLDAARAQKIRTIGLLGPSGSECESKCDLALTFDNVPAPRIQELHLLTIHLILERADAAFS